MDSRAISQSQIPHTSRLYQDYLYDYSRVSEFYAFPPFASESLAKSAGSLHYPDALRSAVAGILREHQELDDSSPETARNLERFAKPGCYAVVTGQQVGLFTGPAFTLYKALTTIKLARTLSQQGLEAVPVFWLATEDHDLEEVNHCFVQDREGKPVRLRYSEPAQVPDSPVGVVWFTKAILPLIESLRDLLPDSATAAEIVDLVGESYRHGHHFGFAFARLLGRLLADHGVLLLESIDHQLHALSRGLFQTAVDCSGEISNELRERNAQLTQAGYHSQVRVTENSTVLFLYEEGRRTALRLEDGKFRSALGRSYQRAELAAMLEANPSLFSPSALLRPVMQDALLPTVAYVGGPSEIAYLAQSAPLYERMLGRMPVIFPRASFTILDPASNRLLSKYALALTDVFSGKQTLREKMAARFLPEGLTHLFAKASANLEENLEAIQKSMAKLDPTLVDAAANSGQKMQYQLTNLERKAAAAVQGRSDLIERDAVRLENSLFPEKMLQERLYSGISFLARFGMPLLEQLYEQIRLDCGDHLWVTP